MTSEIKKLFFIGMPKLNYIEKNFNINKLDFIDYYNTLSDKKFIIETSKYMTFDENLKNKFIEKFDKLDSYFNDLFNNKQKKYENNTCNNNIKSGLLNFIVHIPEEKK